MENICVLFQSGTSGHTIWPDPAHEDTVSASVANRVLGLLRARVSK
jgi:hypothetical protein